MSDTRERNLYIVTGPNGAVYVHTISKAALQRVETTEGSLLVVAKDGANIHDHITTGPLE